MKQMAAGEGGHPMLLPRTDPEGSGLPLNGQSHTPQHGLPALERVAIGWLSPQNS